MKKRYVTIDIDGERLTHLPEASNYATLCGLDGDDPAIGMNTVHTVKGKKVDCEQCHAIWQHCKTFRKTDFEAIS